MLTGKYDVHYAIFKLSYPERREYETWVLVESCMLQTAATQIK